VCYRCRDGGIRTAPRHRGFDVRHLRRSLVASSPLSSPFGSHTLDTERLHPLTPWPLRGRGRCDRWPIGVGSYRRWTMFVSMEIDGDEASKSRPNYPPPPFLVLANAQQPERCDRLDDKHLESRSASLISTRRYLSTATPSGTREAPLLFLNNPSFFSCYVKKDLSHLFKLVQITEQRKAVVLLFSAFHSLKIVFWGVVCVFEGIARVTDSWGTESSYWTVVKCFLLCTTDVIPGNGNEEVRLKTSSHPLTLVSWVTFFFFVGLSGTFHDFPF